MQEEVLKVMEQQFEVYPSPLNREKLHLAQAVHLHREEHFWRHKSGMEWFKDEERNTNFFFTQLFKEGEVD